MEFDSLVKLKHSKICPYITECGSFSVVGTHRFHEKKLKEHSSNVESDNLPLNLIKGILLHFSSFF